MCSGGDLRSQGLLQAPVLPEKKNVLREYSQPSKPDKNLKRFAETDGPSFPLLAHATLVDGHRLPPSCSSLCNQVGGARTYAQQHIVPGPNKPVGLPIPLTGNKNGLPTEGRPCLPSCPRKPTCCPRCAPFPPGTYPTQSTGLQDRSRLRRGTRSTAMLRPRGHRFAF